MTDEDGSRIVFLFAFLKSSNRSTARNIDLNKQPGCSWLSRPLLSMNSRFQISARNQKENVEISKQICNPNTNLQEHKKCSYTIESPLSLCIYTNVRIQVPNYSVKHTYNSGVKNRKLHCPPTSKRSRQIAPTTSPTTPAATRPAPRRRSSRCTPATPPRRRLPAAAASAVRERARARAPPRRT